MSGLESFVLNHLFWAYAILFGGMFIEGEVFFLTAAVLAWQGYLNWWLIAVVAFFGVILGDIAWYWLGRKIERIPLIGLMLKVKMSTYQEWLEENFFSRYGRMAFYSKFLYYINRLTPLVAGWHKFDFRRFLKIHFFAGLLWVTANVAFGLIFGLIVGTEGMEFLLKRVEYLLAGAAVVFIGGEYIAKTFFSKKIKKQLKRAVSSNK